MPEGHTESSIKSLPGAQYLDPENAPAAAAAASASPDRVRASHLLIKHRGSRRPSSWKEQTITRSKQDAIAQLEKFHADLKAASAAGAGLKDQFASLASVHS